MQRWGKCGPGELSAKRGEAERGEIWRSFLPGNLQKAASWGRRCDVKCLKYTQGKNHMAAGETGADGLRTPSPTGASGTWWETSPSRAGGFAFSVPSLQQLLGPCCDPGAASPGWGQRGQLAGGQGDRRWQGLVPICSPPAGAAAAQPRGRSWVTFLSKAATGGDQLNGTRLLLVSWGESDAGCQVTGGYGPGEGRMSISVGLAQGLCSGHTFFPPRDAGWGKNPLVLALSCFPGRLHGQDGCWRKEPCAGSGSVRRGRSKPPPRWAVPSPWDMDRGHVPS